MKVSKADLPAGDEMMMAKMRDLGVQHCTDDKWSDDAIKCMTDAKTEAEAQTCYGKLTPDQRDKMNQSAMELSSPPGGAGSAGSAGSGSAGAGSASGSGSAGSAMGSDSAGGSAAGSAGSGSAAAAGSDAPAGSASGSGSARRAQVARER
jgi:hypothetical protein